MRASHKVGIVIGAFLSVTIAGCSSTGIDPAAKPSWERVPPPEVLETDEVRVDGIDLEDS